MRELRTLWREERPARWFFAAHLQGGLGTAAGYVALMLLAYERIGSAWAATAVMLADLIPSMLLGPLLGGLVDRTSRLGCAVASDLVRAGAFAGLMLSHGVGGMIALAILAGAGNALFRPATAALLPSLVDDARLTAANAGYGMVRDAGQLLGPAIAAGLLLLAGPRLVIGINAATFALSALLLLRLHGHLRAPRRDAAEAAAPGGIGAVVRDPVVRTLMGCSGFVVLAVGSINVGELVLAQQDLGAGRAGFALLVSAYGCGLIGGSLLGAGDGGEAGLRRRYLGGMALMVAGLTGSALAPAVPFAMLSFALTGAGDGLFVVSDRVLLQRMVPQRLHGRAFGVLDAVQAWAFAGAVVGGGALALAFGGRVTFAVAGALLLLVLCAASRVLSPARLSPSFRPVPVLRRPELKPSA
jgi:MFS family permease